MATEVGIGIIKEKKEKKQLVSTQLRAYGVKHIGVSTLFVIYKVLCLTLTGLCVKVDNDTRC